MSTGASSRVGFSVTQGDFLLQPPKAEKVAKVQPVQYRNISLLAAPALVLQTSTPDTWNVSAMIVTKEKVKREYLALFYEEDMPAVYPERILQQQTCEEMWRYQLSCERKKEPYGVVYRIADYVGTFWVPAAGTMPKMIYYSCNDLQYAHERATTDNVTPTWRKVAKLHKATPHELLLGGGDQIYLDSLFDLPAFQAFQKLTDHEKVNANFTTSMQHELRDYLFKRYLEHWNRPQLSKMYARIPSINMWDDHDVFDDWGSYEPALQQCAVFQGIYREARRLFLAFQTHTEEAKSLPAVLPNQPTLTEFHDFGEAALITFDTRTCRTQERILPQETYNAIYKQVEELSPAVKHLFMAISVPVAYPYINWVRTIYADLKQDIGDFDDHWNSEAHREETALFIDRIQELAVRKQLRISFLSGDVHIGACSKIFAKDEGIASTTARSIINFTSSPAANDATAWIARFILEGISYFDANKTLSPHATFEMLDLAPEECRRFLDDQNFLSLTKREEGITGTYYLQKSSRTFTVHVPGIRES